MVGTSVDLSGVNELVASSSRFGRELRELLFLSQFDERADYAERPPTLEPSLATRWELAPDRSTLTVELRPDAIWSDGRSITTRDLLFTHRAQRADEVAWPYADTKSAFRRVVALDDRRLRVELDRFGPTTLVDWNDGALLPEHAWGERPFAEWRAAGDWFRRRLVVSGPYTIAAWRPGVELRLEPNPRSIAHRPGALPVLFRVGPDSAALVEQMAAGAFDVVDGVAPADAERLARHPDLRVVATAGRQYDFIAWNALRPPFDDPAVRRALTLAIDRQALVDALWLGHARVAAGPVPTGVWARDAALAPWPYDPAGARSALETAGYRDSDGDGVIERDGKALRFELSTNSGNRARADALVLIAEQLARVGVVAEPRLFELQALSDHNDRGDYDATLAGWSVDTTLDFHPYFHSSQVVDGWNFVRFADAEVDRILVALRAAESPEAALPLHHTLQRRLHELQPYTFLWEPERLTVVRAGLDGVEPTPLSTFAALPRWRRGTDTAP